MYPCRVPVGASAPAAAQQVVSTGSRETQITHLTHLVTATLQRGVVFPGIPLHVSRSRHARLFTLRSASALARASITRFQPIAAEDSKRGWGGAEG